MKPSWRTPDSIKENVKQLYERKTLRNIKSIIAIFFFKLVVMIITLYFKNNSSGKKKRHQTLLPSQSKEDLNTASLECQRVCIKTATLQSRSTSAAFKVNTMTNETIRTLKKSNWKKGLLKVQARSWTREYPESPDYQSELGFNLHYGSQDQSPVLGSTCSSFPFNSQNIAFKKPWH